MFIITKIKTTFFICLLSLSLQSLAGAGAGNNYSMKTVVLDAGHGGHDTGCNGPSGSYEKNVTLKVILALGKLIEDKYPNIKVLYTRKSDVFITLQDRAETANLNNADLFLSVHCNANPNKSAYGAETYLMGLHKTEANLDVAKRENAVIKLEKNYQKTYEGFDPDSPESMIALSLAQNANIEQSTLLASKVQEKFTKDLNRYNRGVRQAGFWVLYRTTCPAILVETGFLTNSNEEKYLISASGQQELAGAIFNAFEEYKNLLEKGSFTEPVLQTPTESSVTTAIENSSTATLTNETKTDVVNTTSPATISAPTTSTVKNNDNAANKKGKTVEPFDMDMTTTKTATKTKIDKQKNTPPPPAKVIADNSGIQYKVQIRATDKPLPATDKCYKFFEDVSYENINGILKYVLGPYPAILQAKSSLKKAKSSGYHDAFICVYKDGIRLSSTDASKYLR